MLNPETVCTREDLARFVLAMRDDLAANADQWENATLEDFLEALAGWIHDMPGWFGNRDESEPADVDWSLVASMLFAASIYE